LIVLMSWVFVITRFIDAGVFVTSNDLGRRPIARGRGCAYGDVVLFRREILVTQAAPPAFEMKVRDDPRCPAVCCDRSDRYD
jgi:hypothetical protein